MENTTKKVGRFEFDPKSGTLSGPAEYMKERGNALIDAIQGGTDNIFNMTASFSPDPVTAIMVRLQTDFAGWLGSRQIASMAGVRS
jgi:hypothetical protein